MELPSFFRLAKEISQYSEHHQHKLGAVIFVKNKPVAFGFNQKKTHPIMAKLNSKRTTHAEIAAVSAIKNKKRLKGATIVVYRQQKDGSPGMARPCDCCEKILTQYGIDKIIYTTY